jgi:beta-alanine--pyruvate transaminase
MAETGGVELANELLKLIELHDASNIAAVIVEPMSGSAGVIVPPQGYLQRLREICTQHNILLIFDEVITAYGRMGKWTGAEYFGVTPDIMNTAKQVTNGAIPLGAVIASSEIYNTFMQQPRPSTWSSSATATPTPATRSPAPPAWPPWNCCKREHLIEQSAALAPVFEEKLHSLKGSRARGRHPQLRPGRRPATGPARWRRRDPPVRSRYQAVESRLLRALRRRHPAVRPDLQHQARSSWTACSMPSAMC